VAEGIVRAGPNRGKRKESGRKGMFAKGSRAIVDTREQGNGNTPTGVLNFDADRRKKSCWPVDPVQENEK